VGWLTEHFIVVVFQRQRRSVFEHKWFPGCRERGIRS